MTPRRLVTAAAAFAVLSLAPLSAFAHESCAGGTVSSSNQCESDPSHISRGEPGGFTHKICESHPGAPYDVQYDKVQGGSYICTHYHSCNFVSVRDLQAFTAFCGS
ncbi:MAG: hypothetical protein AAF074_16585 [Pseudomonadota bacterium]